MYKLYGLSTSGNSYKVRLMLAHLGETYQWEEIPSSLVMPRTPEFLAINPNGKVPVLILPDGQPLAESDGILYYLGHGTPYLPEGRLEQAQVVGWMCFEQHSHEPYLALPRVLQRFPDDPRHADLPELYKKGYFALGVLEKHLSEHDFIVGEAYSVADMALFAYTHVAHEGGYDLAPYPAVGRWLQRVASQAGHIPITAPPGPVN
ncbi:MAG: glutathione S-transferase family protein [Candidatus Marinimicrobia bacterium]|nr:glutathione S-transferase family protein [Candidatus Neomarinimicrobiota bacterium]